MVASHLLKSIHYWNDLGYGTFQLCYIRNKEKQEVDFLILKDSKPWVLIEVKESSVQIDPHLAEIRDQLGRQIQTLQLVRTEGIDCVRNEIRIVSAPRVLSSLI